MILNREYLESVSQSSRMELAHAQEQVLNENRTIRFAKQSYDLFLSHSYLDKPLVYTVIDLFNDAGFSVYVDWIIDTKLDRSKVDRATAETLRERMDTCQALAYISTKNIADSRWCPWELGYVDGKKNGRCAILPILASSRDTFIGQEYLGLYPYIDYETPKGGAKKEFWVNDPQDSSLYVSLKQWLGGKDPYKHE